MKNFEKTKKNLKEETMPYSLDDKGRIDIKIPEVLDNLNSLLTGITEKNYNNPSSALEKVRKTLANFHIHIPKYSFNDGDDGYAVFDINQFGQKMGMTNDGQFIKNMNDGFYLYFEYALNDLGNFSIFCEVVDEDELDDLMKERESERDDDDEGDAVGAGSEQDYDTNREEHKGQAYTVAEEVVTKKPKTLKEHLVSRGWKLLND